MRPIVRRALSLSVVLLALGVLQAPAAHAIVPNVFEISAGIKAGAGLEIWTEPSGTTVELPGTGEVFDIPFFDEARAGFNSTIGLFMEMRFVRYLGLEVGLFITRHKILEDTDWTYTEVDQGTGRIDRFSTKTEQELVFTSYHVPVIVKGILPVGDAVRLSLGIGPEFAIGSYAYATFKKVSGDDLRGARAQFTDLQAESQTDTYLALQFGVDIKAGPFRVPIDLRWAYNLSQPDGYYDRITYFVPDPNRPNEKIRWQPGDPAEHPTSGTIKARNSMYLQLLVGVAFDY